MLTERSRDRILSDGELGELALALGLLDGRTIYQREADGTRPISRQTLDAMALALLLGLRAGEVLRIQAGNIQEDSETGFVLLRVAAHGGKTAAARRDLPLPPLALSVLRRRQQACGDGLLFPSPSGKTAGALTVDGLACAARLLTNKLGHSDLEGRRWTPHDLRRTCASILGEYDTPDAVQKRILGHASDGVTARVYDRSRRLRQMREALMSVEKHTIMQARKAAGLDTEPVRIGG
ncbi:integrase [Azospirillum fermentarium]|uniref:tyrosine-type recombinase/integrase n=1 Tax=Azospirillum fermentarium TaxID=1233114 RepID=UPI002225CD45|nr:tyrosine-type recombinase/integrase [Azospirillum fermentarium]MCW2245136.1 integrase [Azospirillum fermentarium]